MNSFSQIIDNMLEFYGARTSGSEERKLQRLARFVNFTDWHYDGMEQQVEVPMTPQKKKSRTTRQEEPVAHRTRSRQAIAHRTRSCVH